MRSFKRTLPVFLVMMWSLQAYCENSKNDTLSYEILLNEKVLNDLRIKDGFISSLDITANQLIMLSSADQFYLLGWGGIVPFGKPVKGDISSFAFTGDSTLLTIRNDELCYFDSEGRLSVLYKLPEKGMGISSGENLMYIYDRIRKKEQKAVYAIAKGGKYAKLFDMPDAITALTENKNSLIFASGNSLFEYNLPGKELKAITVMPAGKEIESVATDTSSGRIYFSSDNKIYSVKDTSAVLITNDFGGILKCFGKGLIVFNPEKRIVVRIVGIEGQIEKNRNINNNSHTGKTSDILTNSGIIDMVRAKLSDQMIIGLISRSNVNFNLDVDSMVELSENGVSSEIIMEMKKAAKRQASQIINK
jgi:hypothetical protein